MTWVDSTVEAQTRLSCAKKCVAEASCKSYSHCGLRLCYMSHKDRIIYPSGFEENEDCVYAGMKWETMPACNVSAALFPNDKGTYHCGNDVKMNFRWQPWVISAPFNETEIEYAQSSFRECKTKLLEVVHPANCGGGNIYSKTEVIRAYSTELTWNEAKSFCMNGNGFLYGHFDFTRDQIDLMTAKLESIVPGVDKFWMGASDEGKEGSWRDLHRNFIPHIYMLWGRNEPNGGTSANGFLMEKQDDGLFYGNDVDQDSLRAPFLCQFLLEFLET